MIFRYRVSLPGIKGFARVYEISGNCSLYSFSKQMRADMNFPQDQMVLFKAFDKNGCVCARYGMFDLGAGTIDDVNIAESLKRGEVSFQYFYDTTNAKSVIVTFEGEAEPKNNVLYPLLVEMKGPDPEEFENGYVAFEDLPDDKKKDPDEEDDEDWDEEDADEDDEEDGYDDEDGEEIYE